MGQGLGGRTLDNADGDAPPPGIQTWQELLSHNGPGDHMILFYELPRFERAAVVKFIQEGIARRAKNVLLLPDTRISGYQRLLRGHGMDNRGLQASGSLVLTPTNQLFGLVRRSRSVDWIDAFVDSLIEQAKREGFPEIRLYSRINGKLFEEGELDLNLKMEAYWQKIRSLYPMVLLCSYRCEVLSPEKHEFFLGEVMGHHTHLIPSGRQGWSFSLGNLRVEVPAQG